MIRIVMATAIMAIGGAALGGTMDTATGMLKEFEGFRPSAYKCEAGRNTIGYGFTGKRLVGKGRMTETAAAAELARECERIAVRLRLELGQSHPLSVAQEAAVVSFIYNVGWENFKKSRMCRLLKEGKRGAAVGLEFRRWVYVTKGGRRVKSKGLAARRLKEARAFLMG